MALVVSPFKREILETENTQATAEILQTNLVNMIDLALLLKQAHWNVLGRNFRSVHLQLDEILVTVRAASDEIAERIATLGVSPDGRARTVSESSQLATYPCGFLQADETLSNVGNSLKETVTRLREGIEKLAELDPISEDLCIGISAQLEKHLWMVQAQEA